MMNTRLIRIGVVALFAGMTLLIASCANPMGPSTGSAAESTGAHNPAPSAGNDASPAGDENPAVPPAADQNEADTGGDAGDEAPASEESPAVNDEPSAPAESENPASADENPSNGGTNNSESDTGSGEMDEHPAGDDPIQDAPSTTDPAPEHPSVIVNPDGSLSFTQDGLVAGGESTENFRVQDDGTIDIVGAGERRAYANGFSGSVYRVVIDNARILSAPGQSARGWAVIVQGGFNDAGSFEGYTVQIDPGLNNSFAIRRWVDGREQSARQIQSASALGIDLMAPMDLVIDLNHDRLSMSANGVPVYTDVALEQPGRTGGFVGLRAWSNTTVTVDSFRVIQEP